MRNPFRNHLVILMCWLASSVLFVLLLALAGIHS